MICLPSLIEIKGTYRKRTDEGRLIWERVPIRFLLARELTRLRLHNRILEVLNHAD